MIDLIILAIKISAIQLGMIVSCNIFCGLEKLCLNSCSCFKEEEED